MRGISVELPSSSLNAIVGPSGCGKTTLVKSLLRLNDSEGECRFAGTVVDNSRQLAGRCGFVPQFSVAHENLSVGECLEYSFDLTVGKGELKEDRVTSVLRKVGLIDQRSTLVKALSGGQRRRLGLALEFISDPDCLICDEVTSGLDPLSEDQILELLRQLVDEEKKTFICIIHNLAKLPSFDHITVLYEGHLVFAGCFDELKKWFSLKDPLNLYRVLATCSAEEWRRRWEAHAQDVPQEEAEETSWTEAHNEEYLSYSGAKWENLNMDRSYCVISCCP